MKAILVVLTALGIALGAASLAAAQPAPRPVPTLVRPGQPAQPGAAAAQTPDQPATVFHAHDDIVESSGQGMAVLFWLFAIIAVAGAIFVISRRNLIAAVMGMVGSFLGIAAVYMMLYANFLAVIQMLVYAGAIMVLFVFVIMILNRPEDEPIAPSGRAGQVVGGIAILYLVARLAMLLVHVQPPDAKIAKEAPADIQLAPTETGMPGKMVPWGGVEAVGNDLFGPGLFPFEAISILLLVAVVGAIAVARPLKEDQETVGTDPNPGTHGL